MRVEGEPVVVVDDEEPLAADAFHFGGKQAALRSGYMLQEGVGEDEINALVLHGQAAAISHNKLVRPGIVGVVSPKVVGLQVDHRVLTKPHSNIRHGIGGTAYLQTAFGTVGIHSLKTSGHDLSPPF